MPSDLAELANVTDALALERCEVGRDTAALQVNNTGEGLVEQRADGKDGKVASLGLSRGSAGAIEERVSITHGEGVNHGLEAHVNLAGADDLSDILENVSEANYEDIKMRGIR